jgi:hypothetical protein
MRVLWRTLPRLALPAVIGLGAAYLATSFVPRPTPSLRPPEELRAKGLGYAEESPVRAVLERNVLGLESAPFTPPGPSALSEAPPPQPPAAAPTERTQKPPSLPQAGFAPLEPSLTLKASGGGAASALLSGGSSVQGRIAGPAAQAAPAAPAAQKPAASAPTTHAAKPVRDGLSGFRLVGVIAGGERPVAMLQVDGAAVSLRPGEAARGWTLESVEPAQVTLKRGQEVRRLPLGAK